MKQFALYISIIFWLASFGFAQSVDLVDNATAKKWRDREAVEVKQTKIDIWLQATKNILAKVKVDKPKINPQIKKPTKKSVKKIIKKPKTKTYKKTY